MTLLAILDKRVVASDGYVIGRVYDFRALSDNGDIYITHIRVGAAAWIVRLGLQRAFRFVRGMQLLDIPWQAVATVDTAVKLKPEWDKARCEACREQAETA